MRIGDCNKTLEEQARDLGYKSLDAAMKRAIITAVPIRGYKDFRLEAPGGEGNILDSLRFHNTVVTIDDYNEARYWTPIGVPLTAWEIKWLVHLLIMHRDGLKSYEERYIDKANELIHRLRQSAKFIPSGTKMDETAMAQKWLDKLNKYKENNGKEEEQ